MKELAPKPLKETPEQTAERFGDSTLSGYIRDAAGILKTDKPHVRLSYVLLPVQEKVILSKEAARGFLQSKEANSVLDALGDILLKVKGVKPDARSDFIDYPADADDAFDYFDLLNKPDLRKILSNGLCAYYLFDDVNPKSPPCFPAYVEIEVKNVRYYAQIEKILITESQSGENEDKINFDLIEINIFDRTIRANKETYGEAWAKANPKFRREEKEA